MHWGPNAQAKLVGHILKVHDVVVNYSALSRAMTEDTGEDCSPAAIEHQIQFFRAIASRSKDSSTSLPSSLNCMPKPTRRTSAKQLRDAQTTPIMATTSDRKSFGAVPSSPSTPGTLGTPDTLGSLGTHTIRRTRIIRRTPGIHKKTTADYYSRTPSNFVLRPGAGSMRARKTATRSPLRTSNLAFNPSHNNHDEPEPFAMPKEDDTPPTNIGEPSPFKATTPRLKLSVSKPKMSRWQLNLSSPRKSFADMAEFAEDDEVDTGLFDNLSEDEEEPPASKKPKLAGGTWIQPEFQADQ